MSIIRQTKNSPAIEVVAGDIHSVWKRESFPSYADFAGKYAGRKFHKWDKENVPAVAPISGVIATI